MNLAQARAAKKLTQEELQVLSGVDQTTISAIERGKNKNPSWDTVRRLSDALGVAPDALFPPTSLTDETAFDGGAR